MQWGSKATLFSDKPIATCGITGSLVFNRETHGEKDVPLVQWFHTCDFIPTRNHCWFLIVKISALFEQLKRMAFGCFWGCCCLLLLLAVAAVAKTKSCWSVVVPCPHGVPKSMPCWHYPVAIQPWQTAHESMMFLYFLIFLEMWDMVLINLHVGHPGFASDWLSFTRECAEHLSGHRHRWRDTAADLFWVSSNMARNPQNWTFALLGKPLNWMEDFRTSHVGLLEGNLNLSIIL